MYTQTGEREAGEQCCRKGAGGPVPWQVECESLCPGCQEGQSCPEGHQAQYRQLGRLLLQYFLNAISQNQHYIAEEIEMQRSFH